MEVSHTSPTSHDVPTEGHGLSGGPVANLYIALRCAGVFLKSDVCAKWKKKGRSERIKVSQMRKKSSTCTLSQ